MAFAPVETYNYQHISGAGTFTIHNGAANLVSIVVNTAGTLCTVYDSVTASGSVVAKITTTQLGTFTFKARIGQGITIVTTGTNTDLTVMYGAAA